MIVSFMWDKSFGNSKKTRNWDNCLNVIPMFLISLIDEYSRLHVISYNISHAGSKDGSLGMCRPCKIHVTNIMNHTLQTH
jgi:hypothetical protein